MGQVAEGRDPAALGSWRIHKVSLSIFEREHATEELRLGAGERDGTLHLGKPVKRATHEEIKNYTCNNKKYAPPHENIRLPARIDH